MTARFPNNFLLIPTPDYSYSPIPHPGQVLPLPIPIFRLGVVGRGVGGGELEEGRWGRGVVERGMRGCGAV